MVMIECDYCKEEFNKKPSMIERSNNDFCSIECNGNWKSENITGKSHHQYKRIETECANCSSKLKLTLVKYERSERHYCGSSCQAENEDRSGENNPSWKDGKNKVECNYCGNNFKVYPHRYEQEKTFYCGYECRGRWATEEFSGKNHPLWNGYSEDYGENWLSVREEVRQRDEGFCQVCGKNKSENGNWPDVHHIVPVSAFKRPEDSNFLRNLISLCHSCHSKAEGGRIELPPPFVDKDKLKQSGQPKADDD